MLSSLILLLLLSSFFLTFRTDWILLSLAFLIIFVTSSRSSVDS